VFDFVFDSYIRSYIYVKNYIPFNVSKRFLHYDCIAVSDTRPIVVSWHKSKWTR